MRVDSPQKHFSISGNFDSGSSCVYQLDTSSTLIAGYSFKIESMINCTVSIYTRNPNKSKISHITDIDSSETLSSIQIDHMEDVYIVVKSQGQNAKMSMTISLQTSAKDDEKGNLSQGNKNGDESYYNISSKRSPIRNTYYSGRSSSNNDDDDDEDSEGGSSMHPAIVIAIIVGALIILNGG